MSDKEKNTRPGRNGGTLKSGGANGGGRPKGSVSAKPKLKKLLKDLAAITDTLTAREKLLAYQLYGIVEADLALQSVSSTVRHLYFMESEFGIKIGVSSNVAKRLNQIKMYAPSVKLLKVVNYAAGFEVNIHNKFSHLNIKGNSTIGVEWFFKSDDLIAFIDEIETIENLHNYFNPKGPGQLILL
jgi:hypothetical protein